MQLIFLIFLAVIFYQDIKERQVSLVVLLGGIILGGYLYLNNSFYKLYIINVGFNCLLVLLMICLLYLYSRLKLKQTFFNVIGVGDLLFFLLIALSFPIFTFLVLFSSSLVFSLVLFVVLKSKMTHKTVPLAGFQALFLILILFLNLAFDLINIYAI